MQIRKAETKPKPKKLLRLNKKLLKHTRKGNKGKVIACLEDGADMNTLSAEGKTLVQLAEENGHHDLLAYFTRLANSQSSREVVVEEANLTESHPHGEGLCEVPSDVASEVPSDVASDVPNEVPSDVPSEVSVEEQLILPVMVDEFTELHAAAQDGDLKKAIYLLQAGWQPYRTLDIIFKDTGETPLFIAARLGHAAIVKLLIDAGADFEIGNNHKTSPLGIAVKFGRSDVAKLLAGVKSARYVMRDDIKRQYQTALAAYPDFYKYIDDKNYSGLIQALENGFDINCPNPENGRLPLQQAVLNKDAEMVHFLLCYHASVDALGALQDTCLLGACRGNQVDIAEILLSFGANPDRNTQSGKTPYDLLVTNNNKDAALYLFDHDKYLTEKANSDLKFYAQTGNIANAADCLKKGANINFASENNKSTALHRAAEFSQGEMIHFLLDNGAAIDLQCAQGQTALAIAATKDSIDIVKLLLDHGADPMLVCALNISNQEMMTIIARKWAEVANQDNIDNIMTKISQAGFSSRASLLPEFIMHLLVRSQFSPSFVSSISQCFKQAHEDIRDQIKNRLLELTSQITDPVLRLRYCQLALDQRISNPLSAILNVKKNLRSCSIERGVLQKFVLLKAKTEEEIQASAKACATLTSAEECTPGAPLSQAALPPSYQSIYPEIAMPAPPSYAQTISVFAPFPPPPSYASLLEIYDVSTDVEGNMRFVEKYRK